MNKARKFIEDYNQQAHLEKGSVGNMRGAAYALFKYLERLDDNLSLEKGMSRVEKNNVLGTIDDLHAAVEAAYKGVKKDLS